MNKKHDLSEHDLDEFLDGKSDLSKIYDESDPLTAPAHLEFVVKRMARDAVADHTSNTDSRETDTQTSTQKKSKPGMSLLSWALVASLVMAVSVTIVLFEQPSEVKQVARSMPEAQSAFPQDSNARTKRLTQQILTQLDNKDTEAASHPANTQQMETQKITQAASQATNDVKKTAKIPSQRQQLVDSAKNQITTPAPQLAEQEEFEMPAQLNELLQQTSASEAKLDALPPEQVLNTWLRSQWVAQVEMLNKQGKYALAKKYVAAYPKYFPKESIAHLIKH